MIFSKDIVPMCAYCENGKKIVSTDDIICSKKGLVKAESSCKKFVYSPFNRVPPKRKAQQNLYTKEDFEF